MNESPNDPQAVKWLAIALVGQVNVATYKQRDADKYQQDGSYWHWLSHQPPGEVLFNALGHYPLSTRLIAHLVELAEHQPELFAFENTPEKVTQDRVALRRRVRDHVIRLNSNDSSHSLLVRHRFELARSPKKAAAILARGANSAERRLLLPIDTGTDEQVADDSMAQLSTEHPTNYWDFALLLEFAQSLHQVDPQLAQRYYQCLTGLRPGPVPASDIEKAHLLSGQLAIVQGHPAGALTIWRQGIERINTNSLDLIGAIARLVPAHGTAFFQQGGQGVLRQYQKAIDDNAAFLANASPQELTLADRKVLGREIHAARWRFRVLESQLLSQTEAKGDAIERLRLALTQSVDVSPAEEQLACVQLAEWYLAEGASDCAATYFERAIGFTPDNFQLRQRAANAWLIAGNRFRATEHMRKVSGNATLLAKLGSLEAMFQRSLAQQDGKPDFGNLQIQVRSLQQEIQRQRSNHQTSTNLREVSSRLELIQACLPPAGTPLEEHLEARKFQADIASIAQEYRDEQRVQRFAADFLAALGAMADSECAFAALHNLHGVTSTEVAIARARALAAAGRPIAAAKRLLFHDGKTESETRHALLMSTQWAFQENDLVLAYQALSAVAHSQRTCHDLFTLAKLANQLPADSEVFTRSNVTPSNLANRWKTDLMKRERNSCGFTTCLIASSLIDQLSDRTDVITFDDPQLAQAQRLVRDLILRRPGWSETAILASELSLVKGNVQQAVRVLRDAIMAGDESPHLHRRIDQLQKRKQSSSNQWAHFTVSQRDLATLPQRRELTPNIRRLLETHQSITAFDACVSSTTVSISCLPAPTCF